ncbi:MAG: ATP-binding domain-containing protein, partial [Clostridia bacterium]|nr:ATP-binding domain-containing protein [Clostridia bacterium]
KSQGSEFSCVVMPCVGGPPMLLTRNLFYTALTRAKRLVVLVGREGCVEQMVNNNDERRRYTSLQKRLAEAAEGA